MALFLRPFSRHFRANKYTAVALMAGAALLTPIPDAAAWQCGGAPQVKKDAAGPTLPAETVERHSALPSTLVYYIHAQNYLQPEWSQKAIAWPLVEIAKREGLDEHEQFFLGQLEFMSLKPNEAYAIFQDFADRDDWYGWMARQRLAIMNTRAFEDFEKLEQNLAEERKKFRPSPEFASIMGFAERSLCQHWTSNGEHDRAVKFVADTIAETPRDAAYRPLYLAITCFDSFKETERQQEAFDLAQSVREDMAIALKKRQKNAGKYPSYDPDLHENMIEDRWYGRSKIAPYNYATYQIEELVHRYDGFLSCERDHDKSACRR